MGLLVVFALSHLKMELPALTPEERLSREQAHSEWLDVQLDPELWQEYETWLETMPDSTMLAVLKMFIQHTNARTK